MKHSLLFISLLFLVQFTMAQNIETTVITIDLSRPEKNSVKHSDGLNKLVVKNRHLLAISLENGNPFKYTYKLTYQNISLFDSDNFQFKEEEKGGDKRTGLISKGLKDIDTIQKIDLSKKENVVSELNLLKSDVDKFGLDLDDFILKISLVDNLDIEKFKKERTKKINKFNTLNLYSALIENAIEKLKIVEPAILEKLKNVKSSLEENQTKLAKTNKIDSNAYILPIDINGDNVDYVEITLERIDKSNPTTPEIYKYKIWIRGGLKIDVSAGTYITSLFDAQYSTTTTTDANGNTVNNSTITKDDVGNYDFGFGAMVNISLRGGSWIRPTINFGTLLTSNQKFQILAGGGFILGKNERWIIHGGLSMGRISEIKNTFVADGTTEYDLGQGANVPTTNKFKFGHFFGVSYNFGKQKKNKNP
ncbi:hypothetical protein ACSTS3_04215 [Aquimarina muelleri]|uniref:hypothetical protein n=1 Tax=Aquimarina muelleri TaxID=279356 RepID=UPI003F686FE1